MSAWRAIKLHPFGTCVNSLAHVPKECYIIAPLALTHQFFIALFLHVRALCISKSKKKKLTNARFSVDFLRDKISLKVLQEKRISHF